jgi:hypothetical protein
MQVTDIVMLPAENGIVTEGFYAVESISQSSYILFSNSLNFSCSLTLHAYSVFNICIGLMIISGFSSTYPVLSALGL